MPKNGRHSSVSPHIMLQQWMKLYRKRPKTHSENCWNLKTLLLLA